MQTGHLQQFWWCSAGQNPALPDQVSDTILYQSIDTVTHVVSAPQVVLAETPGSWDALYTCNPRVIRGAFVDPLGNGKNYSYEMFYVGVTTGTPNNIGAAFSNDGVRWDKYPNPIIVSEATSSYGVGQPVAYNADGTSNITLFYEDSTPNVHHLEATSTDGVHFTAIGTLTEKGLDPTKLNPTWADMGYDPTTKYWYAAFNLPTRAASTTGNVVERGQYGFQLYRIPDSSLLTGEIPWQMLQEVDTNSTGYESNFLPSLLHDMYGKIDIGAYPKLTLFVSTSLPRPSWDASPALAGASGDSAQWAIALNGYDPSQLTVALRRYRNAQTYMTTTGYINAIKFFPDVVLGHLYTSPSGNAVAAFYGCKAGSTNYFVSLDSTCNDQMILGIDGYGYARAPKEAATVALFSCVTKASHFLSKDPACEGKGTGALLGYALP